MNALLHTRLARQCMVFALVGVMVVMVILPLTSATAGHFSETEELTAQDNIGAAIAYSSTTFTEPVAEVALGRDDVFADSLASGLLQATRPLLLTNKDALPEPVKAELGRLSPDVVHVLGGESAVAPAVVQALEAEGYKVQRHSGPTRIDTAVEVAKALGASATKAIIARANGTQDDETKGFADSLAAGGWAADAAMPVLLTETEKLSDPVANYLKSSAIKEIFVVGGQSAVSEAVVTQLTAMGMTVKRVSGPTRFHTALAIAGERGFSTAAEATKVIVTEGQAADAWAAGFAAAARSAKEDAPIVLAVGTTLPEPTATFLSGDPAGPNPSETPTPGETPTATETPSPTESPTATESPGPSETPSGGGARAALICAPKLATEACDAAATALGQVAGGGTQIVTFTGTAVSRFDHLIGKVTEPAASNGLAVSGCGYTNEPIHMDPDGTFYLMMAAEQGTCAAEFAITTSAGVRKQTVELTIGEDFSPASTLPIPELVAVRPVKSDEEGIHLRFVFDEPVAPSPAIDSSKFHLFDVEGKHSLVNPASLPSAVMRDPRNSRAVIAIFSSRQYQNSTAAAVQGGRVCSTSATAACPTPTETALNGDVLKPGAVRDADRYPNPSGHFGLQIIDRTESVSKDPDLLRVSDYRASDQSVVLHFSEAVAVPANAKASLATLLLKDGTIKASDEDGWSRGPTDESLRVSFSGDGLSPEEMELVRRAYVEFKGVAAADTEQGRNGDNDANTPVTAIVSGGGISDLPDFVDIEDDRFGDTNPSVTFVFEEELFRVNELTGDSKAGFALVLESGKVLWPAASPAPKIDETDRRQVKVTFQPKPATTDRVLYVVVRTNAAQSFGQQWNFADTIRIDTPVIHGRGITQAPDLLKVTRRYVPSEACTPGSLNAIPESFRMTLDFDEEVTAATTAANIKWLVWWLSPSGLPRSDLAPPSAPTANGTSKSLTYSDTGASPTQGVGQCPTPTQKAIWSPWTSAPYVSIDGGMVADKNDPATPKTVVNYPAGLPVPN